MRTTISGWTRCERIIRRETRQARAIADFGEYRNAKCFSKEIKDRQRYNFGEFNSRSHERYVKKMFARDVCGTEIHRNHTDLNIRKARKKKKKKAKEYKYATNVEYTFNRRPQFHNNISTTRRKRRVTNTSGIATDKSTIDKENATY